MRGLQGRDHVRFVLSSPAEVFADEVLPAGIFARELTGFLEHMLGHA